MADEPPHLQAGMSARVYFDISSLHAQGQDIGDISTLVYYDAADQIDGNATSVSAPVQWGDANSCVYYVTINWGGDQIGLPPSRAFEFGINAAIGPQYKFYWNSAASPFMTGLAAARTRPPRTRTSRSTSTGRWSTGRRRRSPRTRAAAQPAAAARRR